MADNPMLPYIIYTVIGFAIAAHLSSRINLKGMALVVAFWPFWLAFKLIAVTLETFELF